MSYPGDARGSRGGHPARRAGGRSVPLARGREGPRGAGVDEGAGRAHPRAAREAARPRRARRALHASCSTWTRSPRPSRRGDRYFYIAHATRTRRRPSSTGARASRARRRCCSTQHLERRTAPCRSALVALWDGKKVVFAQKPNAADEAMLHVLDVDTGEWSKVDVIPGGKYASPSVDAGHEGFYYEWLPVDPSIPVAERPGYTELRFHSSARDPKTDALVHPRTGDPKTFLGGDLVAGRQVPLRLHHPRLERERRLLEAASARTRTSACS